MATLCPFCGHDPYHRVDNGVGLEAVAVNCCELGVDLFSRHEKPPETVTVYWDEFVKIAGRLAEQTAELERLQDVLQPFADHYDLNDCQDMDPREALEVPIADLRNAKDALGQSTSEKTDG